MRRALRLVGRLIGAALSGVVLFLTAAAVGGLASGDVAEIEGGDDVEIALLYGLIHVDFLLPATDETRAALAFAAAGGV